MVSFLCGVLSRKKPLPQSPVEEAASNSGFSGGASDAASSTPKDAAADVAEFREAVQLTERVPPPPGVHGHHKRSNSTASCHRRSNSAAARLVSSMSMKVLSSGGAVGRQFSRRDQDHKPRHKDKKSNHEDSIWKKTIILGEKCRVPDEDDDNILYDEHGKKISTYHPKTHSGVLSYSRSSIDHDDFIKKIGRDF